MSLRQSFLYKTKKAHLLHTKQTGGLFHVFRNFSIMGYKYFLILSHIPNVFKCNGSECLSVHTFGTVYELVL